MLPRISVSLSGVSYAGKGINTFLTGLYTSVSVLASNQKEKLSLHQSRQIEPCASLFDLSVDILLIFEIMSLPILQTAGWGSLLIALVLETSHPTAAKR